MGSGLYQELADRLMKEGHAYPCFCTAEELDLKRKAAEAAGENPQYDGTWRDADPAEVQKRLDAGEPYTVRFKVPRGKKITISDLVRGEDVGRPGDGGRLHPAAVGRGHRRGGGDAGVQPASPSTTR